MSWYETGYNAKNTQFCENCEADSAIHEGQATLLHVVSHDFPMQAAMGKMLSRVWVHSYVTGNIRVESAIEIAKRAERLLQASGLPRHPPFAAELDFHSIMGDDADHAYKCINTTEPKLCLLFSDLLARHRMSSSFSCKCQKVSSNVRSFKVKAATHKR